MIRLLWVAFIISLPFADLLVFPKLLVGAGQPSTLFAILLFTALVCRSPGSALAQLWSNQISRAFLLFVLVTVISVPMSLVSPITQWKGDILWLKALKQVAQLLIGYMCFAIPLLYLRNPQALTGAVRSYSATLWICTGYAVLELAHYLGLQTAVFPEIARLVHLGTYFANPDQANLTYLSTVSGFPRLRLLASEPAMAGNFLLTALPLAVFMAKQSRKKVSWKLLVVCTVSMIMLTFSASAITSLAAALIVTNLLMMQDRRILHRMAIGGMALLLIVGLLSYSDIALPAVMRAPLDVAGRITKTDTDISTSGRLLEIRTAWDMFTDYPLFGVGIGNWVFHYAPRMAQIGSSYIYVRNQVSEGGFERSLGVNNLYMRLLCETGIVGLAAWLWMWFGVVRAATKLGKRIPGCIDLAFALACSVVALAVNVNAMSAFDKRYWWFVVGLVAVSTQLRIGSTPALVCQLSRGAAVPGAVFSAPEQPVYAGMSRRSRGWQEQRP